MSEPIPGPPGLPFLGNILDFDPIDSLTGLSRMAEIYGPIYKLVLRGQEFYVISDYDLFDEICDEKRFRKVIAGPVEQVRVGLNDGLFTAWTHEHAWEVAHRILTPSFGPVSVRGMFTEMHDIASQMVMKWARMGPTKPVDATGDFTRLTLDTIALCSMETRFNSFYREDLHPFPKAMIEFLLESGRRTVRPSIVQKFMTRSEREFHNNIKIMVDIAEEIIVRARSHPSQKKNLLNAMLTREDPKTGEKMTDASIANNMVTFLVAGHETTAGFLSFICYRLCSNLDVQKKAQAEVDSVVGNGVVGVEHLGKFPYITAIMRETMRLNPVISMVPQTTPYPDSPERVVIGGKYNVSKNAIFRPILPMIMKDTRIWGEDSDEFRPERCLDENFAKIPKNAWKPFGNGVRSCIGQAFAWQEVVLALAMIMQNFNLKMADPSYKLKLKQTLTVKPDNFHMLTTPRDGVDAESLEARITGGAHTEKVAHEFTSTKIAGAQKPLSVFWGGNAGTSESLAQSFKQMAAAKGFQAEVEDLDSAVNKLPKDKPVVIITASYEGEPPDNARQFVKYLETLQGSELAGVKYAVFGNGNHQWQRTYQRIPSLCDEVLEKCGGTRLAERGSADVAIDDIFDKFETWVHKSFFPSIAKDTGSSEEASNELSSTLDAELLPSLRSSHLKQNVQEAIIVKNQVISGADESGAAKRSIELQLPTGAEYRAGDYLSVLPLNPPQNVRRVMKHFGIPFDAMIHIKSQDTVLPNQGPVSVHDILAAYVELSQPATRRCIALLASHAHIEADQKSLQRLSDDPAVFDADVTAKRNSILDLLERYHSISITFVEYLSLLPQLRLRQYSISSSPLANASNCTLTVGVLDQPHLADSEQRFYGVASSYLARLTPGDRIHVAVKQSHPSFHLPREISETPVIMIAAGTGIAPFRGFIQERAVQKAAGRETAPMLLFYGVQSNEHVLHADELDQWTKDGVLDAHYAFSRAPDHPKAQGCKYVQDRFWADRADVKRLFQQGAKVFVCGGTKVGEGLKWRAIDIHKEFLVDGFTQEDVEKWFSDLRNDRYMVEVFG